MHGDHTGFRKRQTTLQIAQIVILQPMVHAQRAQGPHVQRKDHEQRKAKRPVFPQQLLPV